MKVYKRVLIVTLALAFVASMGAASVSAQTSEAATTPIVGASYKTPTTLVVWALSQSVKKTCDPWNRCYYQSAFIGYLRAGSTGLPSQKVNYYYRFSTTEPWKMSTARYTGTSGKLNTVVLGTSYPTMVQLYYVFPGTSTYAAAMSNVVTVKHEDTKTTPYLTTLNAYAPKQVVPKGTLNQMWVKLTHGQTPLTGQYVFVWKYSSGKFVIVSRIITRTGTQAGMALADYRLNNAGTGLYKFVYYGTSPSGTTSYARSESNAVQLIWT